MIVGNFLGSNALAAVTSTGSLIFLLVGFFNGTAMGAGVVIARFFGAKDYGHKKGFAFGLFCSLAAYPPTWSISSLILLVYMLKADWIHNFEKGNEII